MTFNNLDFQRSYSVGPNTDITNDFLIPALKESISYKRSVGYFSCASLLHLAQGLNDLYSKNGKVKIITSPNLSEEDIRLIDEGYRNKRRLIEERLEKQIINEVFKQGIKNPKDVVRLIESGVMEIKIATRKNSGLYHDKVGILEDEMGNKICFVGSLNETFSGYTSNYEKIRVFTSWESKNNTERILEEEYEFDQIWNAEHPYIETYHFPEALKQKVIKKINDAYNDFKGEIVHEKPTPYKPKKEPVNLRPYQKEARDAWIDNNYHGFFEMATGTGKTWTALFSIKDLIEIRDSLTVVIVAPYIHLVDQWSGDVSRLFPDIRTLRVSGEYKDWEQQLSNEVIRKKTRKKHYPLIVLTTQKSFGMDRFRKHLRRIPDEKLLVVDEAHRFYNNTFLKDINYDYKLGLSATPFYNNNPEKSAHLVNYFGGVVFKYTLEDALGKYLVNYYYHPFIVHLTDEEQSEFNIMQSKIASCFKNGKLIKEPEVLGSYIQKRNAILAQSNEKDRKKMEFIKKVEPQKNMIVYCGNGYTFRENPNGNNCNEDIRYIDQVTKQLRQNGYRLHRFTSRENLKERNTMIEDFTKQNIDVLAAIRCLDEGVNIPSIQSAIILASTNDPREFIQRRGRILRMYKDKKYSNIYDVIVLPHSKEYTNVAKIELQRYYEYARLALNFEKLEKEFYNLLENYGLVFEDIVAEDTVFDDNKGDVLDE